MSGIEKESWDDKKKVWGPYQPPKPKAPPIMGGLLWLVVLVVASAILGPVGFIGIIILFVGVAIAGSLKEK